MDNYHIFVYCTCIIIILLCIPYMDNFLLENLELLSICWIWKLHRRSIPILLTLFYSTLYNLTDLCPLCCWLWYLNQIIADICHRRIIKGIFCEINSIDLCDYPLLRCYVNVDCCYFGSYSFYRKIAIVFSTVRTIKYSSVNMRTL